MTRSVVVPVRANVQAMPGVETPRTVGEVEVEIRSLETSPGNSGGAHAFRSVRRAQMRESLRVAGGLGLTILASD